MLPSKAANPPRITAKISTIASNVSSICTIMARIQPQWGSRLAVELPCATTTGCHMENRPRPSICSGVYGKTFNGFLTVLRRDGRTWHPQDCRTGSVYIASYCPPQYRWSVESIRLLARATEASVLHAAPVVQTGTTSSCLPTPCPVTHRCAATMPRGGTPNYNAPVYGRSHSPVLGQNAKHTADRPI